MYNAKNYKQLIDKHTKKSPLAKDTLLAFVIGGLICALGELLAGALLSLGTERADAYLWVTVSVIFLSGLLTALGIFDMIAKYAGAGTLVPVSGFANSVISSALDSKHEGLVSGLGVGIFSVAGPVILYASVAGIIYGAIYYIFTLFSMG